MRVDVQIACEKCGESHGTVNIGPQKLAELRTAKKMAELIGGLLPMFLRQGIEHECTMTDEIRAEVKKYLLKNKCPVCGDRVGTDPKTGDIACGDCPWRCTRAALQAVMDSL